MSRTVKSESTKQKETDRKNIVVEHFKLVGLGKFKEGLRFFAPDCKTHNPYISGSIENITDAMIAASKDMGQQSMEPAFAVKHVLADGDLVVAHTEFLNTKAKPSEGGLRQAHLFRFKDDKIVEYWDITQQVLATMRNASGAF
jgi:predicted SnoaL-like aldol condensation-catalyzing enzyme